MPPFLKWAGGKRWQVPLLRQIWDGHVRRRLVEPFCGGASVALGLEPRSALLNDVNPHLINLYRRVAGAEDLGLEPWTREAYYEHRGTFNDLIKKREPTLAAAAIFYYLNRFGFNGLCRFNRKGWYNVPVGKNGDQPRLDVDAYAIMRQWTFACGDFARLKLEPSDFVYCDPPYDAGFVAYVPGGFGWPDQVRLAEWAATHPGPMLLTNLATPRIVQLYRDLKFHCYAQSAPRRIASDGDRRPASELLASNQPLGFGLDELV